MTLDYKKLWGILTFEEKRKSVGMLVLVTLMAFSESIGVVSIMPFLSVLARPEVIHENHILLWLKSQAGLVEDHEFIAFLGILSASLVVLSSAFKTITLHLVNRFTFLLRHSISARLLNKYLNQPYGFFLNNNPSGLSRNVLSEVDQLQNGLIRPLSQLVAQGAVACAMILLLIIYDPMLAISLVTLVGLLYGMIYVLVRKRLKYTGVLRQEANGERFQSCSEVLGGIKDIKITGAGDVYLDRFRRASREYSRHQANAETLSQSPLYMVEVAGYSGLVVLALILMKESGDISQVLPALGLYGFAAYRLLPSVQIMYRGFAQLKFSSATLDAIHQHLMLPNTIGRDSVDVIYPKKEVRLEGITFAYPNSLENPVVRDFNMIIPVNSNVGIVGKSGAGKSTVMDILLGLLQPQSGMLTVDGVVVDSSNIGSWQRSIGYVPQHIYIADTSIIGNIAFGVSPSEVDMRAVEKAARVAQIHDFICDELPEGYFTNVGDRGIRLSGGQRQRLGIARALYRDPPILFMDEATSALDEKTERAVLDEIMSLSGEKTIVFITHSSLSFLDARLFQVG